ncbi:unnamed protein product [Phaedon cochleariae]|uniref:Uncharacterized protein n=1 Tax=Phaedon cochleariae TaxID=80249 RepID=A0A9P0DTT6_PHACE|nr:unnamed protein product [Phaedon cochleariae]
MAIPKTDKRIKDIMTADEMWKVFIRSEDDSGKIWKYNWGWILQEYEDLKKKMDEKTATSELLKRVTKKREDDDRKLGTFPQTFNHRYGWIAEKKDFQLEIYGPDFFKPIPLPDIYKVPKH